MSLAKKCRSLTVSVNKERGLNQSIKTKMDALLDDNERLKRELELVSSPAARAAATRAGREATNKGTREAPRDSGQLQRQVPLSYRHERFVNINVDCPVLRGVVGGMCRSGGRPTPQAHGQSGGD